MIIRLVCIGKTTQSYLKEGIGQYVKRLSHYARFEYVELADVKVSKGMSEEEVKSREAAELMKHCRDGSYVILFDEGGKTMDSVAFATHLEKRFHSVSKDMVFMIGGPYGFHEQIYARSDEKIALSAMTFSHQMVRLIAVEQIYRAMTILRNEPYHHV